jgi:hypothetical protein
MHERVSNQLEQGALLDIGENIGLGGTFSEGGMQDGA